MRTSHLTWVAGFLYALVLAAVVGAAFYLFNELVIERVWMATDMNPELIAIGSLVAAGLAWLFASLPGLMLIVVSETEQSSRETMDNTARIAAINFKIAKSLEGLPSLLHEVQAIRMSQTQLAEKLEKLTAQTNTGAP